LNKIMPFFFSAALGALNIFKALSEPIFLFWLL
jgi:hypothetical protein